jgi:ADP-ribosylation factor-like protein 8
MGLVAMGVLGDRDGRDDCWFTERWQDESRESPCSKCQSEFSVIEPDVELIKGSEFTSDSLPTVAFNKKEVKKGHVSIKCWDLGGQPRFRSMWERYCRGVNAIIFVVDAADKDAIPVAKEELHALLSKPTLDSIPLLVLGNKSDLSNKLSVDELIDQLDLKSVVHREISCYGISAKEETNLEAVLQWLVARSGK